MRVKHSLGTHFYHNGDCLHFDENEKYILDQTRSYYLFNVVPFAAPRMTQSDKWKVNPNHHDINKRQRKPVTQYFEYKNELLRQATLMQFEIKSVLDVLFLMPMPDSWSVKKKSRMNGLPCKVKPDTDNLTKAIKDTFCKNDSNIWKENAEKRWAYKGSVIIYDCDVK